MAVALTVDEPRTPGAEGAGPLTLPQPRALSFLAMLCVVVTMLCGPWLANLGVPEVCAYKARTGRPCLGCGGTHAFRHAVAGDLRGAWRFNTLGAFAGVAAWLLLAGALVSSFSGRMGALVAVCLLLGASTPGAVVVAWIRWMNMLPSSWP
jgi:hypothetical protein